jgi:hypothetical protein
MSFRLCPFRPSRTSKGTFSITSPAVPGQGPPPAGSGFMSTQRRGCPWRLLPRMDCVGALWQLLCLAPYVLLVHAGAGEQTAPPDLPASWATKSLPLDLRYYRLVRPAPLGFRRGSPPVSPRRPATAAWSALFGLILPPIPVPAVAEPLFPSLP